VWMVEENKQNIELLKAVAESVPFPFYVIDAETYEIRMSNEAAGDCRYKKCYEYTHGRETPCEGAGHPCGLKEVKHTGRPAFHEHLHYRPDGTPLHVEVHTYPVLDEKGNVPIIIEYVIDITARREKEGQYRILSQAIEQSPVTVVITDETGSITYVNPKFTEITGYTAEEAIGKNPRILKDPAKKSSDFAELWETITSGRDWHGEFHNRTKNGEFYWENAVISPVKDSDGRIRNFIAIKENVTELKNVREELVSNEERLRLSQEYANLGTWDWNIQTGKLYWSERIAPLFGYPEGTLETTFENFLKAVHPEDREMVSNAISSTIESGSEYHVEHRCIWPDGSMRWLEENGNVLRDDKGTPLRMLGMVQDITNRKHSEQLLLESREEARRANQAKSEFLSSMSHELRTPMNAILGFAQLLEMDEELSSEHIDYVSEIKRAGAHLLELINEVLDLSRIEAGNIKLSPEPVRYAELISECLILLTPLAERNTVTIVNEQSPDYFLFADRLRLKQVIINLLSNAIKYNIPGGRVWIRTAADENSIRISIADDGPGIPKAKMDRLFEPFDRLGAETKDVEGTGIGLTICKKLIEMMNGSIGFASTEGEGTVFWIEIPPADIQQEQTEKAGEMTELFQSKEGAPRYTVLYIEDNPSNLRLVERIINKQSNITLVSAHTASVGLELAEVYRPGLILLDLNLPDMDGFAVLEKLKETDWGKDIPAVAISANAMSHDIEKGKQAGFAEYLTKPLDVARFLEIVETLLPGDAAGERTHT
jgi:PAS domain S-box-containing protein